MGALDKAKNLLGFAALLVRAGECSRKDFEIEAGKVLTEFYKDRTIEIIGLLDEQQHVTEKFLGCEGTD